MQALYERLVNKDRVALGQAMTLVESSTPGDREKAAALLEICESQSSQDSSFRFAISGAPGVGKSTLIEALGKKAVVNGHKVGILTIDPTSTISQGSILGDKARMQELGVSPDAFIRTSPAGSILGGLGRRTFELMTLLTVAGYELIFLETVGVGQSEHIAWKVTDGFILVIQPGSGDELQGIKRGITEMADIVLVNKTDGALAEMARVSKAHYQQALHYLQSPRPGWTPKVVTCSAVSGEGIESAWELICSFRDQQKQSRGSNNRKEQHAFWLQWSLGQAAQGMLLNHPFIKEKMESIQRDPKPGFSLFRTEYEIEQRMSSLVKGID